MAIHRIPATPDTVRWGAVGADIPPVLTVASGDTVVLECVSGGPDVMPPPGSGMQVPPALAAIQAAVPRGPGHIVTGPVAVAGAAPGDMLEVRVDKIEFGADWGYCGFRPLAGTLPEDFPERFLSHIPIDRERRTCRLPYGVELPLAPFFGVMGVAPPPAYGTISTVEPREHGGNIDCKELVAGSTLYLPVNVDGALLYLGDGHAAQGDGESCGTAIECGMTTEAVVSIAGGRPIGSVHAETPAGRITFGFSADLNEAMGDALDAMVTWLTVLCGASPAEALALASTCVDLRVTQVANVTWGVHALLPAGVLSGMS